MRIYVVSIYESQRAGASTYLPFEHGDPNAIFAMLLVEREFQGFRLVFLNPFDCFSAHFFYLERWDQREQQ